MANALFSLTDPTCAPPSRVMGFEKNGRMLEGPLLSSYDMTDRLGLLAPVSGLIRLQYEPRDESQIPHTKPAWAGS